MGNTGTQDQPVSAAVWAPGQTFVPGASPFNTRRSTLCYGGAGQGGLVTAADHAIRYGFTLAVTPTRYRFKIAANNCLTNTRQAGTVNGSGLWIGVPNVGAENAWAGDFSVAPKQVQGAFVVDPTANGTEYVSPWITNGGEIQANKFAGLSAGFTAAGQINTSGEPCLSWLGAGAAASAGNAAVPTGVLSTFVDYMDIRMEYEYVGSNAIGFFIGTSITCGYGSSELVSSKAPIGHMGPDNCYPMIAGAHGGKCNINGGVGSMTSAIMSTTPATNLAWTRFDLATCVPDYAVIDLGLPEITTFTSLATFQTNIRAIIAYLQGLGIKRIFMLTQATGYQFAGFSQTSFYSGILKTAIAPGVINNAVLFGGSTPSLPYPPYAPGQGGPPGPANGWFAAANGPWNIWLDPPDSGVQEGPFAVTASTLNAANLTLAVTGSAVKTHPVGSAVYTECEGLRQYYNNYIRSLPPGIEACVDMATVAEWPMAWPAYIGNPYFYEYQNGDIHPHGPALYMTAAAALATSVQGI